MKSQKEDIIQELKNLNAQFLLKNKERELEENNDFELSEEFYQNVMSGLPPTETKTIPFKSSKIQPIKIFQIAASIAFLVTVSILTYTFIIPANPALTNADQLEQLVSQTSSQEIYDYLNDNGMPADEEFLTEYVNTNIDVSNLN